MKKQPKRNGGAGLFSRNKPGCSLLLLIAFSFPALSQLSVIGGGGPLFPWKVDSVTLVVKYKKAKNRLDSLVTPLDTGIFAELKNSIDSTIHYVDAVRTKREEIGGSATGPRFDAALHFMRDKKRVVQVSFSRKRMRSALLDVKSEKYPFVVTFKPEFARKLDSLAAAARKKPHPPAPSPPGEGEKNTNQD